MSANPLAVIPMSQPGRSLTAANVREHVNLIQEVMQAVMKKDTHYGVIPGCDKPSLYKAGSEVLLTTFRIAVSVQVEDLSTADCIRYRVRTIGTHQQSGIVVGEGIGECSTDEAKYKWRRCYDKREFAATPESRRRMKYITAKGGKEYENMEVRTEPADLANTVLKMAKKRAQIDLTLTATAASDIFTQDIEDLPEEIRDTHDDQPRRDEYPKNDKAAQAEWRVKQHADAAARNGESITHIKKCLASGDNLGAINEWQSLDERDRAALWLATDKGGTAFTDAERQAISDSRSLLADQHDRAVEAAAQEQAHG